MLTLTITTLPLVNSDLIHVYTSECLHTCAYTEHIYGLLHSCAHRAHCVHALAPTHTQKTIHICTHMYAYRHRHAEGVYTLKQQGGTSSLSIGHYLRLKTLWLSYPMPQKKPS